MTATPTHPRGLIVVNTEAVAQQSKINQLKNILNALDDGRKTLIENRPPLSSTPKVVKLHYGMAELKKLVSCDLRTDADLGQLDGYETMLIGKRCLDAVDFTPINRDDTAFGSKRPAGPFPVESMDREKLILETWSRAKLICAHVLANYQIDLDSADSMRVFLPSPATPLFVRLKAKNRTTDIDIALNLLELDQIWGDLPLSAELALVDHNDGPDLAQSAQIIPKIQIHPVYWDFDIPFDPVDTMKMIADLQELRKSN